MIKIVKNAEPDILKNNKVNWTNNLLSRIALRGGFSKLTDADKVEVLNLYNNTDVKNALKTSNGRAKCIYCEGFITTGDLNIEHYRPKAIYHNLTFEWDNLYCSCILCNRPKLNYDTGTKPFIDPTVDDPEELLTFDGVCIEPRYKVGPNRLKAEKLIEKCDLERDNLIYDYSRMMGVLGTTNVKIKKVLREISALKRKPAIINRAVKLLGCLQNLKKQTSQDEEYAGFLRQQIRHSKDIKSAVNIVNMYAADLGLPGNFNWGWNDSIPEYY